MRDPNTALRHRRDFVKYLAASPLLAAWPAGAWQEILADPKNALNVMEFEAAARAALPPAHFGYMATGVDDDLTLRANREGFQKIKLRPRRLIDVSHVDMGIDLFGHHWNTPIFLCPTGNQKAFNPEGELPVARAAGSRKHLMILSSVTNTPIERIAETVQGPLWFQLYASQNWAVTENFVHHAEQAGCPVLAFTVDTTAGRNTETLERMKRNDTRQCSTCHTPAQYYSRKTMYKGIDMTGLTTNSPSLTWDTVRKLRALTKMKLMLKGIETREDAVLCRENGVDGIVVSNHGGRAEESGRGTIECLPEVLEGAAGQIPVLIDGGFRRGTDIFKALALGAKAVGIGRPYLWASSAFGQPGVERVLDILRGELELIMKQCGTRTIAEIGRASILTA